MPTTTDISSFTPAQQAAFNAAAALSGGKATSTLNSAQAVNAPITPATPIPTAPTNPTTPTIPSPTPKPQTAFSSDQGAQYAAENTQKLQTLKNTGLTVGQDGLARYSDMSFATAPSDAVQTENGTWQSGGVQYALGPATSMDPELQKMNDQITAMKTQFDTTSRGMIDNIKAQFDSLIKQQTDVNTRSQASLDQSLLMGGSSRYAQQSSSGQSTTLMSYGLQQIADLNIKEQSAVLQAQQAMDAGDMKLMGQSLQIAQQARQDKQSAAQKLSDALVKANSDLQAKKTAAAQDSAIGSILSEGITDPTEILKQMNDAGYNMTAKDVADTMNNLNPNAKAVADVMTSAAEHGATLDVLKAIGQSRSVSDALSAAGDYMLSATGAMGDYVFYKQQAEAQGQTPMSYEDYQKKQDSQATSQAYSKAYATAAGSAAGAASAIPEVVDSDSGAGLGGTTGGGSILAAAGLSIGAFNFLTQGTASMSRMSAPQRNAIMNEAQKWLNKNGVDISTFQSQYKAYNEVLQKNIQRANQTKIMAGEVAGSADALLSVLNPETAEPTKLFGVFPIAGKNVLDPGATKLGSLSSANVLSLMAGKEVNSPFAQKYSFQIKAMANDLAGYFAASRGASSPELQDQRDAADVISNGMNAKSAQAFKESVLANEEKVNGVVNNAVTTAQKNVWGLFGVEGKYASPTNTADTMLEQGKNDPGNISSFLQTSSNPNDPAGLF